MGQTGQGYKNINIRYFLPWLLILTILTIQLWLELEGWGGNEAAIKANLTMAQPWVPTHDVVLGHIGWVRVRLLYKQTPPMAQPLVPTPGLVPLGHIYGVGVRLLYEQTSTWHSHGLPPQVFLCSAGSWY